MTPSAQLVLDLPQRSAYGRHDFLVAPSNQDAVAWVDRWPDWPGIGLVLYGPEGCGKTHLAQVWKVRCAAVEVAQAQLESTPPSAWVPYGALILDLDGTRQLPETALFHLYNALKEAGGYLLITAREPPARWPLQLPDLASRLRSLPAVMLDQPNEDLFAAVLSKLFADRQVIVSGEVISYLVLRIERSFAAATQTVARLDAAALAERRAITVPFARTILQTDLP